MKFWIFCIITLCGLYCATANEYEFETFQVEKVEEGSDLKIDCNVTVSPDLAVFWKRNGTTSFYQCGRELQLFNVTRDEAGCYICYTYNSTYETEDNATEVAAYTVDVLFPAEITFFSIEPRELVYNHTFTINCTLAGNPEPEIFIYSNSTGEVLYSGVKTGTITVESPLTECEDAGFWVCSGSNYLNKGVNVSSAENVTIYCPPKYKPYKPYWWKAHARTKQTAYLHLENWGFPAPNYTWTDWLGIPVGPHHDGGTYSILTIPDVKRSDFKTYYVTMKNSLGVDGVSFQLSPYGIPEEPFNLTFCDVRTDQVILNWTSGYDMGSTQYFFVYHWDTDTQSLVKGSEYADEEWSQSGGDPYSIIYYELQPDTSYNLTIGAFNEYGGPALSNYVTFKTKEKPHVSHFDSRKAGIIAGGVVAGLVIISACLKALTSDIKTRKQNAYKNIQGETKP